MNDIERKHAIANRLLFLLEDFKSIDKPITLLMLTSDIEELGLLVKAAHDKLREMKTKHPSSIGKDIDANTEKRKRQGAKK